ncbi:MAG: single-stranded DNA-binding protein, partial [Moheibacter sp.]
MNGTLNKVILIGNMGDDVKIHEFDNQNKIGRFPLATSEVYTSRDNG